MGFKMMMPHHVFEPIAQISVIGGRAGVWRSGEKHPRQEKTEVNRLHAPVITCRWKKATPLQPVTIRATHASANIVVPAVRQRKKKSTGLSSIFITPMHSKTCANFVEKSL